MPRPGTFITRGDERGRLHAPSAGGSCPGWLSRNLFTIELAVYVVGVLLLGFCVPERARAQDVHSYVAPDGRTFDQLVAVHVLPDPATTPGVLNPGVTDATLGQTVCSKAKDAKGHDWIFNQRPPTDYTDKLRLADLPAGWEPSHCEEDHGDSIEDGGHPRDPHNLWCMVYKDRYGARVKDVLETRMHRLLCQGKVTLDQARAALMPNWLLGYVRYVGPLPKEPSK